MLNNTFKRFQADCFDNGCSILCKMITPNDLMIGKMNHPIYGTVGFAIDDRGHITLHTLEGKNLTYYNYDRFRFEFFNMSL